jgi:hypothetical protein
MKALALALLAAALAGAAPQDTLVDNPEYQGWRPEGRGLVKFSAETDTGGRKSPSAMILKLKEITPEKVVLEQVSIIEVNGKPVETPLTRPSPPRSRKARIPTAPRSRSFAEGDEEIDVKGAKTKSLGGIEVDRQGRRDEHQDLALRDRRRPRGEDDSHARKVEDVHDVRRLEWKAE